MKCLVCYGAGWIYSPTHNGPALSEPVKIDCRACDVYRVICRIPTGHTGEDRLTLSDTGDEGEMRRVAKAIDAMDEFDEEKVQSMLMSLGIRADHEDDVADACFDVANIMTILVD